MASNIVLTSLNDADIDEITKAFEKIGWHKPKQIYEKYLEEQLKNERVIIVAKKEEVFCGYATLKWKSQYLYFNDNNLPEIMDLNVLPDYRNQGIGTELIRYCENVAQEHKVDTVGIGVGLTADYGNAQRLYIQLGFIPDGRGLHYKGAPVKHGETISADDDLLLYLTKKITR